MAEDEGDEQPADSAVSVKERVNRFKLGMGHPRLEKRGNPFIVKEFFQAIAGEGKMNVHIALLYGANAHHQAEAIFKSFGRALRQAVKVSAPDGIPSTKGVL